MKAELQDHEIYRIVSKEVRVPFRVAEGRIVVAAGIGEAGPVSEDDAPRAPEIELTVTARQLNLDPEAQAEYEQAMLRHLQAVAEGRVSTPPLQQFRAVSFTCEGRAAEKIAGGCNYLHVPGSGPMTLLAMTIDGRLRPVLELSPRSAAVR